MRRATGFTTVELIVALAIAGILSASIGALLRKQQRFYSRAATTVEHRASLRDATSILPAELRSLSPAGGDVLAFSDSSLEIRATIGAGVVCDVSADATTVALVPVGPVLGTTLAAFSTSPQSGDVALVYDVAAPDDSLDDSWVAREVASTATSDNTCVASALVPTEVAASPRWVVRLATALPPSVRAGTVTHVARHVRYRLYRTGGNDWYLGYSEWDGAAFSVVQPVSGPFASYSRRSANTGLLLRYFDAEGGEVLAATDVSLITRVEVVARSASAGGLSGDPSAIRDAQDVTVRVRNR